MLYLGMEGLSKDRFNLQLREVKTWCEEKERRRGRPIGCNEWPRYLNRGKLYTLLDDTPKKKRGRPPGPHGSYNKSWLRRRTLVDEVMLAQSLGLEMGRADFWGLISNIHNQTFSGGEKPLTSEAAYHLYRRGLKDEQSEPAKGFRQVLEHLKAHASSPRRRRDLHDLVRRFFDGFLAEEKSEHWFVEDESGRRPVSLSFVTLTEVLLDHYKQDAAEEVRRWKEAPEAVRRATEELVRKFTEARRICDMALGEYQAKNESMTKGDVKWRVAENVSRPEVRDKMMKALTGPYHFTQADTELALEWLAHPILAPDERKAGIRLLREGDAPHTKASHGKK